MAFARTWIPSKASSFVKAPCERARAHFEASVVAKKSDDQARQDHEARQAIKATRKGAHKILHPADEERTYKTAEITSALNRAIPPAAAAPLNIAVGSGQKHGSAA